MNRSAYAKIESARWVGRRLSVLQLETEDGVLGVSDLRRFKGVASNYLAIYLGWWRMIDRDGDRLTPRKCLVAALG